MNLLTIKGIGNAVKEKLRKINIESVEDLVHYLPSSYIDLSYHTDMNIVENGQYCLFYATVKKVTSIKRGRIDYFKATLEYKGTTIDAIWFNQNYIFNKLLKGMKYAFFGKARLKGKELLIINPTTEVKGQEKNLKGILAMYRTKGIVHQANLRSYIDYALSIYTLQSVIEANEMDINTALSLAHKPKIYQDIIIARRRLAIEEVVRTILYYKLYKNNTGVLKDRKYSNTSYTRFLDVLPFRLNPSQIKAVEEILNDLNESKPMNRLLLGDVGSGKTIVAYAAVYVAAINGHQAMMLAPTVILAEQHYRNSKCLMNAGLRVMLLTKDTPANRRREIIDKLKDGEIDFLIGTHSAVNEDIVIKNLGLVITDEQHRFGVALRSLAERKGKGVDILTMSATPIPRSIAMVLYDYLAVSSLEPRNDVKVKTLLINQDKYQDMLNFIIRQLDEGRQAYIVCPVIEDIEGVELFSAKSLYIKLSRGALKGYTTNLLFGAQDERKKKDIMSSFIEGRTQVLISTTVIEVGIDNPNANIMVIMNAERYGLATLHQLRGRVGRGEHLSYCILYSEEQDNVRLHAMLNYSDGLKLAEMDYNSRGAGDFIGLRQSGISASGIIKVDEELIKECKAIADSIVIDGKVKKILLDNADEAIREKFCLIAMN